MPGFAVVLMLEPGAVTPAPPSWFKNYFLSTTFGVGAYWWKQSNGAMRLEGDVYGWYTFPAGTNYGSRQAIFGQMLQVANPQVVAAKGKTIEQEYDRCIIFIALSATGVGGTNAGSIGMTPSLDQRLSGYMVVDSNSLFNYIAHELGHQLNMSHSFDDTSTKYDPSGPGGQYGHRYCIMSAETYGDPSAGPFGPPRWTPDPTAPRAMQAVGPCLNGYTACLETPDHPSWVKYVIWHAGVDADLTIELESLGSWPAGLPKVVRIHTPGNNPFAIDHFAIEYRNNQDYYDRGLLASVVVVNHGQGGRAYKEGRTSSATFIGEIRLPLALNRQASVYNNVQHGFAIEVQDWKQRSVVLRIFNGTAKPFSVWPTATIATGNKQNVPMGTFDYTNAGVHCVTGVWDVTRVLRPQIATIEWQAPPWPQTFQTRWWIDGQELIGPSGKVDVTTEVDSPFPLPKGTRAPRTIELWFAINGSNQLKLGNRPQDGNFSVDVQCVASFSVATLDRTLQVDFEGEDIEHAPEPEFTQAFFACLIVERDRGRPQRTSRKFLLPEHVQPRPPQEPRQLSRDELVDVFERLQENPLDASVHRQLLRKVGLAPQRVRLVEASAVSVELPKGATPCTAGPAQDLASRD